MSFFIVFNYIIQVCSNSLNLLIRCSCFLLGAVWIFCCRSLSKSLVPYGKSFNLLSRSETILYWIFFITIKVTCSIWGIDGWTWITELWCRMLQLRIITLILASSFDGGSALSTLESHSSHNNINNILKNVSGKCFLVCLLMVLHVSPAYPV